MAKKRKYVTAIYIGGWVKVDTPTKGWILWWNTMEANEPREEIVKEPEISSWVDLNPAWEAMYLR